MDFFERQQQVRRLSWRLMLLFALAVVCIVAVVDFAVIVGMGDRAEAPGGTLTVVAIASLVTGAVIGLASLGRTIGLRRGGGSAVASQLGGVRVPENTTDPHLRRLRNVVEEVALASGVPVPQVYVLQRETGINAFAAGWSPADAAVAVTRGALERLNRNELQGVIAHEFSHVVNGDMRLNIRLIGLLYGILVLGIIGRVLLHSGGGRSRRDSRGGNNPLPLIGVAMFAAGYIGVLVGRLIKASIARQREYLADASAVQYTRQTSGLAGALMKIAGLPERSTVANAKAEEIGHMLFGAASRRGSLLDSHPPLVDRIRALDPSFDPATLDAASRTWASAPPSGLDEDRAMGLAAPADTVARDEAPVQPDTVASNVGAPTPAAYHRAERILDQIPDELLERARHTDTALPLVFGLLLSSDPDVRARQHAVLAPNNQAVADAAVREADALANLNPALRLPLAQIAFPALCQRPRPQQDAVMDTISALMYADGRLSVSEYCLSRLLHAEMYEAAHHHPSWGTQRTSSTALRAAAATLLSTLAKVGHSDADVAEQAFQAGAARLLPNETLPYQPVQDGIDALDAVWPVLDGIKPRDKALLVESIVAVIAHDHVMTVTEIELLRTVCAILHCPLPPLAERAVAA
jgi:Zn-dependent protease with chaperone function